MTPAAEHLLDEIDRLRELGLSQNGLARLLEVNQRTVRRWCSGQNEIPDALWDRLRRVTPDEIAHAMRRA